MLFEIFGQNSPIWSILIAIGFGLPGFIYYLVTVLRFKDRVSNIDRSECLEKLEVERARNMALEDRLVAVLVENRALQESVADLTKLYDDAKSTIAFMRRKASGE